MPGLSALWRHILSNIVEWISPGFPTLVKGTRFEVHREGNFADGIQTIEGYMVLQFSVQGTVRNEACVTEIVELLNEAMQAREK